VLLKNDGGALPLAKGLRRLAVVGALADDPLTLLGSWRARGRPEDAVTVLAGIRTAVSPGTTVTFAQGYSLDGKDEDALREEAVAAAREAEATVVVLGETGDMSGEARSRSSLALPGGQPALVDALARSGRPFVAVLLNGRPLAVEPLVEHARAVLEAWLPGVEGGPAVAAALFGDVNPGGKLPATFPRRDGQVPIPYDHLPTGRPADDDPRRDTSRYHDLPIAPLFPFGHGLSYTTFRYSDLAITPTDAPAGGTVTVSFRVTNTGSRAGDEVAQVYIRDPVASLSRPVRQLAGFARVALAPGASVRLEATLSVDALGYYDETLAWTVEPGTIQVLVGGSSADTPLRGEFTVTGATRARPRRPPIVPAVRVATTGG
jgi:beta-glucosidase